MRFSYTEANLLPDDHKDNIAYNEFLDKFGEEGNIILLGVKDTTLFKPENFEAWKELTKTLEAYPAVDYAISISNLQQLKKFTNISGTVGTPIPYNRRFI